MNNLAKNEFNAIVLGGSVLSFNAAYINVCAMAGAYSATVSHVTGNITRIGISIFNEDLTIFALVASIVGAFMFGSFVAGFMVGDSRFRLGQSYGYALLLESFSLLAAYIFIKSELVIGEWIAAFACGLQNALATSFSGFAVRTTHMTGIVTDIGNILGQACRTDSENSELWRLKVLVPLLVSYLFGAIIGQVAYSGMKDNAMIFPFLFTGGLAIAYFLFPAAKQAKKKMEEGFQPIITDIQSKINWTVKATSFEGFKAAFRPDKDQIEILPEKIETKSDLQHSMILNTILDNDSVEDVIIT